MKELVIISGKGGTGKTSITAAIASLARNALFVDCDVGAADLHLLLSPTVEEEFTFSDSSVACIDSDKCTSCGLCTAHCRFDAISEEFVVDLLACEGCGVCFRICPVGAIQFDQRTSGRWYVSDTRYGKMVHAKLGAGEGNSGKLVSALRNRAKELAKTNGTEYIIIDGPPGIGCPVISAVTGTDAVLIVTEPTISGLHDFERISELANYFGLKQFVCINKADINEEITGTISKRCEETGAQLMATISYDTAITRAQLEAKTITEYAKESKTSSAIENMWSRIQAQLNNNDKTSKEE